MSSRGKTPGLTPVGWRVLFVVLFLFEGGVPFETKPRKGAKAFVRGNPLKIWGPQNEWFRLAGRKIQSKGFL